MCAGSNKDCSIVLHAIYVAVTVVVSTTTKFVMAIEGHLETANRPARAQSKSANGL